MCNERAKDEHGSDFGMNVNTFSAAHCFYFNVGNIYSFRFQEQYIFVHEAILETILCGMNEVDSTKIQKEIEKLNEVSADGLTGFQEKFKVNN